MHALIITSDSAHLERCQIAFLEAGLQVTGSTSQRLADICLRRSLVDVLVIDKPSVGAGYADLLDLGEVRNPYLASILLTDDLAGDSFALPRKHSSLHCVISNDVSAGLVAKMGLASLAEKDVCPGYDVEPLLLRHAMGDQPVFQSIRGVEVAPSAMAS